MNLNIALILFQMAVLLFSLSLHECAHAWTASRLGDQTARMLGRVTLNPIKHIDPFGTILVPAIGFLFGGMIIGWAKPTPVTLRNFTKVKRDDILVTLAGPVSNLLAAIACLIVLIAIKHFVPGGFNAVGAAMQAALTHVVDPEVMAGALFPITLVFYYGIYLNLLLAVFNLLPFPPLDGSHIFRYMLPYKWTAYYDQFGMFSILIIFLIGGRIIAPLVGTALNVFNQVLFSL